MHIHWLQHVEFEGLGYIETWAQKHGHTLGVTRFWAGDLLPEVHAMDLLVVMGGPMGVYDESVYPWLAEEKRFISAAADNYLPILGICLGAQLLASVCEARITVNPYKEIGWFDVTPDGSLPACAVDIFAKRLTVFHWHGDTFELPPSALPLCSSDACMNQGFVLDGRIIGLQFHPEMTMTGISGLLGQCRHELIDGPWIQTAEQMRNGKEFIKPAHLLMEQLLDYLQCQVVDPVYPI